MEAEGVPGTWPPAASFSLYSAFKLPSAMLNSVCRFSQPFRLRLGTLPEADRVTRPAGTLVTTWDCCCCWSGILLESALGRGPCSLPSPASEFSSSSFSLPESELPQDSWGGESGGGAGSCSVLGMATCVVAQID